MLAPQSDADVRPVVDALRRIDPLFDIRWNTRAILRTRGSYDVLGGRTDPTFDGRWELIKWDTSYALDPTRKFVVICVVTELARPAHPKDPPMMLHNGPYAPIGMWLVEHIQYWDAAQSGYAERMARAWDAHERVDALDLNNERAMNQEALEKVYRENGGGEYWMGRGAAFAKTPTTTPAAPPAPTTPARSFITSSR